MTQILKGIALSNREAMFFKVSHLVCIGTVSEEIREPAHELLSRRNVCRCKQLLDGVVHDAASHFCSIGNSFISRCIKEIAMGSQDHFMTTANLFRWLIHTQFVAPVVIIRTNNLGFQTVM